MKRRGQLAGGMRGRRQLSGGMSGRRGVLRAGRSARSGASGVLPRARQGSVGSGVLRGGCSCGSAGQRAAVALAIALVVGACGAGSGASGSRGGRSTVGGTAGGGTTGGALHASEGALASAPPTAVGAAPVATTAGPAAGTALAGADLRASPDAADWPTYHGDGARAGATSAGPDGARPPRRAWEAHVDGAVYAAPVAAAGLVVVATEHNAVVALDAATGATRWSRVLGQAVAGASLPCGNISPSGITGTPVIDTAVGVVHVAAFLAPAHHELVTLDLTTGRELSRLAIDPPGVDPRAEQQRGALAMANGRVYVPFGGLFGDCGAYKGAVVSALVSVLDGARASAGAEGSAARAAGGRAEAAQLGVWETTARREAAVWAPPGPTVAPDGSLYVATGNAGHASGESFDGGDAVVHLAPDLRQVDIFAPADWRQQAADDADLGSGGPVLLGRQVLQGGKTGDVYLLDAGHLGGVGGQLGTTRPCAGIYGGSAVSAETVYLPCRDGVTAVRVGRPGTLTVAWRGPSFTAGGPVLVGGAVWVPDLDSGDAVALDPRTGAERSRAHVGRFAHFATLGMGAGRLLGATVDGAVVAFGT